MLSPKNLLSDIVGGIRCYSYPFGARYLHVLPYYHLFGLIADLLGPLYSGGTICFSGSKLTLFQDLKTFRPTHMNLPPAIVDIIAQRLRQTEDVTSVTGGKLKKIMCAGAPLGEDSRMMLERYGILTLAAYGLTECSPCVSINRDQAWKANSVGQILPCCEVAIVDAEIVVRGDTVMLGYWNDPEATAEIIRDGWLYTGDIGYLDEEGYLFLTERKNSLIVFEDGTKLMPEQLENDLTQDLEVRECLVSARSVSRHTMLDVVLVSEKTWEQDSLLPLLEEIFRKYGLLNRIGTVTVTKEALKRNQLGKLERKHQKQQFAI